MRGRPGPPRPSTRPGAYPERASRDELRRVPCISRETPGRVDRRPQIEALGHGKATRDRSGTARNASSRPGRYSEVQASRVGALLGRWALVSRRDRPGLNLRQHFGKLRRQWGFRTAHCEIHAAPMFMSTVL